MGGVLRHKVAHITSGAVIGADGARIEVEVDLKTGLPGVQIVGMGNKAIDEARQRVRSAITNSSLDFPALKITVNLAPADLPKDGTHFDLPIALCILVASGLLKPSEVESTLFAGELALDGSLRPIRGAIVFAELARSLSLKRLVIPAPNTTQARLVTGVEVVGVTNLKELYGALKGIHPFPHPPDPPSQQVSSSTTRPTFDDVIGHEHAKRALTIAAAGRHNILLLGPPGTGKTLLAQCLPHILPPLSPDEIIEVTKLYSLASGNESSVHTAPPIRSPHHTVTMSAFIGGGLRLRPGELSLAHRGVLLLDEIAEYPRALLESLRQPLEARTIQLARLYDRAAYPADILLAATMNPCPCGNRGNPRTHCSCTALQVQSYQKRLSGPLLDRIDLRIAVNQATQDTIFTHKASSENQHNKVLVLINRARQAQAVRYNRSDYYNSYCSPLQAKQLFNTTPQAQAVLQRACHAIPLSTRSSLRVLRTARTIADLDGSTTLDTPHLTEALQYR